MSSSACCDCCSVATFSNPMLASTRQPPSLEPDDAPTCMPIRSAAGPCS
jgi:hypothetical protein